jgi:hypothetical protein
MVKVNLKKLQNYDKILTIFSRTANCNAATSQRNMPILFEGDISRKLEPTHKVNASARDTRYAARRSKFKFKK